MFYKGIISKEKMIGIHTNIPIIFAALRRLFASWTSSKWTHAISASFSATSLLSISHLISFISLLPIEDRVINLLIFPCKYFSYMVITGYTIYNIRHRFSGPWNSLTFPPKDPGVIIYKVMVLGTSLSHNLSQDSLPWATCIYLHLPKLHATTTTVPCVGL